MAQPVPSQPLTARVAEAVRDAAVQARSTAVVTICLDGGHLWADITRLEAADIDQYGAGTLLGALGEVMRRYPDLDLYRHVHGYALAIPDREIAYVLDIHGTTTSIALGPGARDDADVRIEAITGLWRMLEAATNPGRVDPRRGSAFAVLDQINPAGLPPTNASSPASAYQGQHRRHR